MIRLVLFASESNGIIPWVMRVCSLYITVLFALSSCQGRIEEPNTLLEAASPVAIPSDDGTPSYGRPGPEDSETLAPSRCGDPVPARAPLRRLTSLEYRNTIHEIFGDLGIQALPLPPDASLNGFKNSAAAQAVTLSVIEDYERAAQLVAEAASTDLGWAPCSGGAGCLSEVVRHLASAAYRRPLTSGEQNRLQSFSDELEALGDFDEGVRSAIIAVLQLPTFLYRPEIGELDSEGTIWLTDFELASRLAYSLWNAPPDQELWELAEAGRLRADAELERQIERMLDDPKARYNVSEFHRQWLHVDDIAQVDLDPDFFPEMTPAFKDELMEGYVAFADHVFWEGDIGDLFSSNTVFAGPETSFLYSLDSNHNILTQLSLSPSQRGGILTQPGFLVSTMVHSAFSQFHSPIMRGLRVLESILCAPPLPPPADLNTSLHEETEGENGPRTLRERLELTHNRPECQSCHATIDGIGFTFEHYDALGRYRQQDAGMGIDASGLLVGTDVDGPVSDAIDLGHRLAESQQVHQCLAANWFTFLLGRTPDPEDECHLKSVMSRGGKSPRDMLVQHLMSRSFRTLPNSAL